MSAPDKEPRQPDVEVDGERREPETTARDDRAGISGTAVGLLILACATLAGGPLVPLTAPNVVSPNEDVERPVLPELVQVELRVTSGEAAAPSAEARLFPANVEDGVGALVNANTDPEGRASFSDLDPGTYLLVVELAEHRRWARMIDVQTDLIVNAELLQPASKMTGRVLSATGEAIEGASVHVRRRAPDAAPVPFSAETDDAGAFGFDTLHAGTYSVRIVYGGLPPVLRDIFIRPGEPFHLQVALEATSVIAGRVIDRAGEPASGAKVILAGSGVWPPRERRTDERGEFRFDDVPTGIYEVRAHRGATVSRPREGLRLEPGGSASVTLTLEPGAVLVGTVTDANDQSPIEGAEIIVSEHGIAMHPRVARTDALGQFRVEGLRRRGHQVNVRADGYVVEPPITAAPSEPLEVTLRPGGTVSGTVYDAYDRPVRNARVEVLGLAGIGLTNTAERFRDSLFERQLRGPLATAAGELGVTMGSVPLLPVSGEHVLGITTDEEGKFEIRGVAPGEIQVLCQHRDNAPVLSEPHALRPRESLELSLVMPRGATIRGRVVDDRGFPQGDIIVELRAQDEHAPRMTLAGPDGTFSFRGALGVVILTALPQGRSAARMRLEVASGPDVDVSLVLGDPSETLHGRVRDARGDPLADVHVRIRTLSAGTPHRANTKTGDDGTFSFEGLPAPPYRVEADHPGHALMRVEPVASTRDELEITLEAGGAVSGRVLDDWTREPIPAAMVELVTREDDVFTSARTGADGRFALSRVPIGSYVAKFASADHLPREVEVELSEDRGGIRDADLENVWLAPGGSITGEVRDALGRAVSSARVSISGREESVRTDVEGVFTLTGLSPGYVSLVVSHPRAGQLEEQVSVRQAERTEGITIRLPERYDAADATSGSGISGLQTGVAVRVGRDGENIVVLATARSSRAGRFLRRGDVIQSIDGEPIFAVAQARGALRGPVGVEVVLVVSRRGRTRRVVAPRERYRPRW